MINFKSERTPLIVETIKRLMPIDKWLTTAEKDTISAKILVEINEQIPASMTIPNKRGWGVNRSKTAKLTVNCLDWYISRICGSKKTKFKYLNFNENAIAPRLDLATKIVAKNSSFKIDELVKVNTDVLQTILNNL